MKVSQNKDYFERDIREPDAIEPVPYIPNINIYKRIMAKKKVKLTYDNPGYGNAGDVVEVSEDQFASLTKHGMAEESTEAATTEIVEGYKPPSRQEEDSSYAPGMTGPVKKAEIGDEEPVTKEEKATKKSGK